MEFRAALDSVLEGMGLSVSEQADRQGFSLLFDNEHEIAFEPDGKDGTVVFHAEVGDAAGLDAAALRALLEASLLGANTAGAAFSIEPRLGKVILWKRFGEFPDGAALRRDLEVFLGQVLHWKKRLAEGVTIAGGEDVAMQEAMPSSFIEV